MQKAITKPNEVTLEPMTRQEYNDFRGWELPNDENGNDKGFVVHTPSVKPNSTLSDSHVTWRTEIEVSLMYSLFGQGPVENLSFGAALYLLEQGYHVQRKGWNGAGMYLFLVKNSDVKIESPSLHNSVNNATAEYLSHITMQTAQGHLVPWLSSQTDMLAKDWRVVT